MKPTNNNDEAALVRQEQRSDGEARNIIHDINKLYNFGDDKKVRWVWELLQNAKDVAKPQGVEIHLHLSPEKLVFKHNGLPFETKHLIAILYKTSTKSLNGQDGNTGKYGTGFVTTHVLNKKLTISGVHVNDAGKRIFEFEIDRTPASMEESMALQAMKDSLEKSFSDISEITRKPAEENLEDWSVFTYNLNDNSFRYAEKGVRDLEKNLAFTLLINEKIAKVIVESAEGAKTYSLRKEDTPIEGIRFATLTSNTGLLYQRSGKLIIGIPAKKEGDSYRIISNLGQAVLFKEFPLIGTEEYNLPVCVQHEDFHPAEERDGISIRQESETETNPIAEKNRTSLIEFIQSYLPFLEKLTDAKLKGAFFLAKSGMPDTLKHYIDEKWYATNIQKEIRYLIREKEIVGVCSGESVKISEAKFVLADVEDAESFYDLAARLIPNKIPDKESVWHWAEIISQETEQWSEDNIILDVEGMLTLVSETIDLSQEDSFTWLKDLYDFLERNKLSHLGETIPIYPNEAGNFCTRDEVAIFPEIDDEFLEVSRGLGRPLEEEFLAKKLGEIPSIQKFDLPDFYKDINDKIGGLEIGDASDEQKRAIFHVCCLFRSDRAFKRESWFNIINELLPDLAPEKKYVSVDYETYWKSAEFWSIKYVRSLLEASEKPTVFSETYFDGNLVVCFQWLNDFLSFVFNYPEENREVLLKRQIIPTQSDEFKPYDESIFLEQDSMYFDETIKDIFKDHTPHGDPRAFLIDNRISCETIRRKSVEVLTTEINKLFADENIETKVKKGGSLNPMFLKLNNWFENFSTASTLLPTFSNKRATLYVLALGEGFSKQIMDIQKSGKSMDDIAELAKIKLSVEEMKKLEAVADELGVNNILSIAKEMIATKREKEYWIEVGKEVEEAFREAIEGLEDIDVRVENPDNGKDFELYVGLQGYSVEVKSVAKGKENVRMSILQGRTAVNEKYSYALCVLARPDNELGIDKDYFIKNSKFVTDIGYQIGDKISEWDEGLRNLVVYDEIRVQLDAKSESLYVNRSIWKGGISFDDFVEVLKTYFAQDEAN